MSTSKSDLHDASQPTLSNDAVLGSLPSTSKATVSSSTLPEVRQSYLDVPSFRRSRPSLDSTYSELSELSFHSNELHTHHPLIRSISQDAAPPAPPGSRFIAAVHSFYVANYGAMLVMISQFFGAGMNVSTRLLETTGSHGKPMHPFQILFVRQSITASLCTAYGVYSRSVPHFPWGPREVRWLLVARGLCGFFGVFGMYFSLLYLPLSEATVLTFLAPILTCYLCSFVIPGETFSRQQQLAGFVSLVGVIFIAQPASLFSSPSTPRQHSSPPIAGPSNSTTTPEHSQQPPPDQHLAAIGIAMLGVVGSTGALTSIRAIGTRAHAFISINYFSVWCSIVSMACLIIFPDVKFRLPGNMTEWCLLASLGLCGFVMQFLLTAGLAYRAPTQKPHNQNQQQGHPHQKIRDLETTDPIALGAGDDLPSGEREQTSRTQPSSSPPSKTSSSSGTRATSMLYTQMLFALAGDKLIFGVTPTTMSWVGSVLILAGAVWVSSARDSANKGNDNNADRNRFARVPLGSTDSLPLTAMTRPKKNETNVTEEVAGLLHDHDDEAENETGNEVYERHYNFDNAPAHSRTSTFADSPALANVEGLEMHDLRPTISGN
ncbi:uncharacterized protein Z518_01073 [Rhinocladiella mackenziei CBS 650.93]|uniref:EamA domain-containing protein n=1 Tax=Rhinocladiella mackenziei CBS 650.93 TaxID=1442369 RepID=A0A0D2G5D2_9EURO|nr:uncharacterized protein Z518_01073 [Rhinocladiella mackenziei CBS 650.93]KIX09992.1 hypothetical protein Z518_01073 [Rhinocladiella mackenziei CBS 650.93]